jgi:hypothetical protein
MGREISAATSAMLISKPLPPPTSLSSSPWAINLGASNN